MSAAAARYRDEQEPTTRWITLGQACKLLGVNESTLRRWADAGHVQSFRTPGGHRRFSEEGVRAMMAGEAQASDEPYTSIGSLAISRIRRRLQRGRSQAAPWYAGLREQDRVEMRPLGNRLASLVSDYLTRGSHRAHILNEAREIARDYGSLLVRDGLSLRDSVDAFTFFRKSLDETAMEEAQKNDITADKAMELWDLLSNLEDQVLLSIAESYEEAQYRAPIRA